MSGLISIDEIGQCRSGPDNDIDLEAVFGGRISGKKQTGLKVNPLFTESTRSISDEKEETPDINGNMNNVHVITYESIPTKTDNMKYLIKDPSVENGIVVSHKDIITQVDDISDIDSTVPSMGSIDSLNENFGSPYKLLTAGEKGVPPTDIRNSQSEADMVLDKNKRNSKTFRNNYGLLHGEPNTDSSTSNVPVIQQNGYHEDIKTSKKESYHLLSYDKDGLIINENNDVVTSIDKNDNDNGVSGNKEGSSAESSIDSELIEENESESNRNTKDTDILPTTILTEAHVHTVDNDRCEPGALSDKENEIDRSLSRTNSVLSDDEHEVIERVIEISEEWPELNELAGTANEESGNRKETDVKFTVSDKTSMDNDQTKTTTVEIEVEEDVPIESNDILKKSKTEIDTEHNDSVVVEINETIVEHDSEAAKHDTDISIAVRDKDRLTNENNYDSETVYTEIHSSDSKAETSSNRTLKSILANNGSEPQSMTSTIKSEHQVTKPDDEIQECKSVKFSEDTVFNENKSKKYRIEKVERIHLRDIYRGKISSNAAAKLNPLYKDDGELEDKDERSMTEEERAAYLEAVKKMTDSTKDKQGNLNTPTYMEHYLILKAHGLKPENFDVEQLPSEIERPAYERLIERTLAKERRKLIIKWTLVILTVGIITAVATTLGVMLRDR